MNIFLLNSKTTLDPEGNILSELLYTYDENNNLIDIGSPPVEPNDTPSFPSSSSVDYIYDENNNLISLRRTSVAGFSGFTTGSTTNYTYDENNNLITQTFDSYVGSTPDGIESSINYTYDDHNNLILETREFYNFEGILNNTDIISYVYDDRDNLISQAEDINNDGTIESVVNYSYDERDNLISQTEDINNDGTIDRLTTYTYDDRNNLVLESLDNNRDGNPDRLTSYVYNSNNDLLVETLDEDADGGIDRTFEYSYVERDEFGNEIVREPNLSLTEVHRFYQYERDFHFYSAELNEIDSVRERSDAGELFYTYEAEKFQALSDNKDTITGQVVEGVKPVYRFFNRDTGAHLYTTDKTEKDSILDNLSNYDFEGTKYYAFESEPENVSTIPVYRLLNNNSGTHLLSSDANEIDYIMDNLSNFSLENNGNAVFYVVEL